MLIGRSGELESLRAALALARDGQSGTLLLVGEAGVGKTTLVSEMAEEARREGMTVLKESSASRRPNGLA